MSLTRVQSNAFFFNRLLARLAALDHPPEGPLLRVEQTKGITVCQHPQSAAFLSQGKPVTAAICRGVTLGRAHTLRQRAPRGLGALQDRL